MPKVTSKKATPAVPLQQRLDELVWLHGYDCNLRPDFPALLRKTGLQPKDAGAGPLRMAERSARERLHQSFLDHNDTAGRAFWVMVDGDDTLDPARNPDHPIRGEAFKRRQEQLMGGTVYTCEICRTVSQPKQPLRRHVVERAAAKPDGTQRREISSEVAVCGDCAWQLSHGATLALLRERHARPPEPAYEAPEPPPPPAPEIGVPVILGKPMRLIGTVAQPFKKVPKR